MYAKITSAFRFPVKEGTRKFCPGEVATPDDGDVAKWAIDNGFGKELSAAEVKAIESPKPADKKADEAEQNPVAEKAAPAPENKAAQAPDNKAAAADDKKG